MGKFRPLLELMTIDRFGFDIEFLYVANYHGLRLAEIPVRWNDVAGSKVSPVRDTRRMMGELAQIRRNSRQGKYELNRRDAAAIPTATPRRWMPPTTAMSTMPRSRRR